MIKQSIQIILKIKVKTSNKSQCSRLGTLGVVSNRCGQL